MKMKYLMLVGCMVLVQHFSFAQNMLSTKEKKDGWQLLFDGKITTVGVVPLSIPFQKKDGKLRVVY